MFFSIHHTDPHSAARSGEIVTDHGTIKTPVFMPVGTRASVKTVSPDELKKTTSIVLANTYHLALRPGVEIIEEAGGLHSFMSWNRPILTDSGGYQVFSLAKLRKKSSQGVSFRSHIDGAPLFLGPREAIELQQRLGADIIMVFDDCPAYPCSHKEALDSVQRTIEWARCCQESRNNNQNQACFGIVQGSTYRPLREECAESLISLDFDGYAIGGVSVGEPQDIMYQVIDWVSPLLPEHKPRYVMGIGTPPQIVHAVSHGIDMFDCVLPTRVGRNGGAYTRKGMTQIKAGKYKKDFTPIEENCACYACTSFTKAYIRHLLNVGEILGMRLLSLHNLFFYQQMMRDIRYHIKEKSFTSFRKEFLANYRSVDRTKMRL